MVVAGGAWALPCHSVPETLREKPQLAGCPDKSEAADGLPSCFRFLFCYVSVVAERLIVFIIYTSILECKKINRTKMNALICAKYIYHFSAAAVPLNIVKSRSNFSYFCYFYTIYGHFIPYHMGFISVL